MAEEKCWSTADQLPGGKRNQHVEPQLSNMLICFWKVDQLLMRMLIFLAKSTVDQLLINFIQLNIVDHQLNNMLKYVWKHWSTVDLQSYFEVTNLTNNWSTCCFSGWFMLINCWSTLLPVDNEVDHKLINMLNEESKCWSTVDQLEALSRVSSPI